VLRVNRWFADDAAWRREVVDEGRRGSFSIGDRLRAVLGSSAQREISLAEEV
jgi:hypothetical protein